jgi:hypothetical protein
MDRITAASVGTNISDEILLRSACANLIIDLDEARAAVARSYGEKTG